MLQITPSRLEIESAQGATATATLIATNRITTPVTISSIALAGETGVFTITPPGLPLTLQPGTSTSVTIQYDPSDAVLESFSSNATLVVVSDSGLISTAEIIGTVINAAGAAAAAASVTVAAPSVPSAVDAGITGDGSVVPDQLIVNSFQGQRATGTFVFTNITTSAFTVTSLTLAGDNTLKVINTPALPLTVPVNGAVSVQIEYDPPDQLGLPAFLARGVLTVTTSQPKLLRAAIVGRILNPEQDSKQIAGSEVTPRSIELVSIQGVLAQGKLAISNTGSVALIINNIDLVGDVGEITLVNPPSLPLSIPANSSNILTLNYEPPNVQNLPDFENQAILTLLTNSGRVITVEVTGKLLTPQKLATGDTLPGNDTVAVVLPAPTAIEPANPKIGTLWLDSSVTPNRTWIYDGFVWVGQTMTGVNANKFSSDRAISVLRNIAGAVTATLINGPTANLNATQGPAGAAFPAGVPVTYSYSFVTPNGETTPSPSNTVTPSANVTSYNLSAIVAGPAGTTARRVYRQYQGTTYLATTIANNTTTTFSDTNPTGGTIASPVVGFYPPGQYKYTVTTYSNTGRERIIAGPTKIVFADNNAAIAAITLPLGVAETIGRRVYRSNTNGELQYLVGVIPNNTTTVFNDILPNNLATPLPLGSGWVELTEIANNPDGIKLLYTDCDLIATSGNWFLGIGITTTELSEGVAEDIIEIAPSSGLNKITKVWKDLYFFNTANYPKLALGLFSLDERELLGGATWVYSHIKKPALSTGTIE
jgi:hypothetical protein